MPLPNPFHYLYQSLWRDEAFSVLLAQESFKEMLLITAKDFQPPLYHTFLFFWVRLFGDSEVSARLPSLLFFLISSIFIFLILKHILKRSLWWSGAFTLLYLYNPLFHYYAFEARSYALFLCITTISTYFFLRFKNEASAQSILIVAFVNTIGLYTHYFYIFVVAAQILYILIQKKNIYRFKTWAAYLLSFLLFLPWVLFVFMTKEFTDNSFWIPRFKLEDIGFIPFFIYFGYEYGSAKLGEYITQARFAGALFCITLYFLFRKTIRRDDYTYFLLLFLVPIVFVLLVNNSIPLFLPRYLIAASAGLFLLFSLLITKLSFFPKIVFYTILLFFTLTYSQEQIKLKTKFNYKSFSENIKRSQLMYNQIYVSNVLDIHLSQYYFKDIPVYLYNVPYETIPSYVGKSYIPEDKLKNFFLPGKTLYFYEGEKYIVVIR